MKLYNPIGSGKASGKAYGGVFSFNRGLATFKKYTIPTIQNTVLQLLHRNRFSFLTKYWKNNLTYEQIQLWNEWSLLWTDIYGNAVTLTGINKFCIINNTLLIAGRQIRTVPPTLTPSTLVINNYVETGMQQNVIAQVSPAEIIAQAPFLFVEVIDLDWIENSEPYGMWVWSAGKPISQKPLNKNYSFAFVYTETDATQNPDGELITHSQTTGTDRLLCIKITRYNNQGFWSNTLNFNNVVETWI